MDKGTLKQLKQVFYSQNFFTRYVDYLANRDFNNLSLGQNRALDVALTDSEGKRYYGYFFAKNNYLANKGIYLKHCIAISERQAWASVEEFLDIVDNEAVDELNDLSKYLIDLFKFIQSDYPKNSDETKQKSEDTIIRLIVKHFWKENPSRYIEGDFQTPIYCPVNGKIAFIEEKDAKQKVQGLIKDEIIEKTTDVNGNYFIVRPYECANEILDKATFDVLIGITEERLVDDSLDNNYKQVINYLKAVKKIRNNQAHNIGNTVEQGASSVFEFCLFVYLHLVLTLRQSLIRRGGEEYRPDNNAEFFVEIEKPSPSLSIKLFRLDDNDEVEIKPVVKEDHKLVFNVDYYVKYKLAVNDRREIETEFIYNSFTPHAIIPDFGEPVIRQGDEDYTHERTVLFADLLNKMGNLEDKLEENILATIEDKEETKKNTQELKELSKTIASVPDAITKSGHEMVDKQTELIDLIKQRVLPLIILLVIVILGGIFLYLNSSNNQGSLIATENNKSSNAMVLLGDSLLNIVWDKDYRLSEQVGQTYREAIGQLRRLAEQRNNSASIELCHLYLSGKGCYDLDSALFYAQKKEVRETKEGQGLYAYLLLKRGEMELARKEFLRAIDPEEPYICLTKALYDMQNSINNQTTMHASKQTCENAYQRLSSINNDDALYEKAIIDLWGIQDSEDNFIIHPNFGKAFNALSGLANRNPFAILVLGDIYNMMGDVGTGLTYHGTAFYCGVQEKAAIAINSSLLLNPDGFTLTDKGRALKEIVAGKTNVIGGIGGLLSNYVHYIDGKAFDLAINAADSLFYMSQHKTGDISLSDTSFISRIRITSRLMSGKSDDFSEAVHLAMQRDNCTDSIAVANYLKGVCLAKGYGCQKDISKSDALIMSSAERGTYTESLYTQIKRRPPVLAPEKVTNWSKHYINPDLLRKSPKLACGVMEIALKYGRKYRESKNLGQLIVHLQYYLPKEMNLMNDAISSAQDFDKMPINNNYEALERINDYICLAMGNGQSYMAQVGCSVYKVFCDKYRISQDIEAYERFRVKQRGMPDEINANKLDSGLNMNPLPQYTDYAY